MKNNKPLFNINGYNLYREKNLVIMQMPIFFVCKDENSQRYLVIFVDFDEDEYILCPVSNKDLFLMLTGKITMREPFFKAQELYVVKAGDDIDDDDVKKVMPIDLEDDTLPKENSLFEIGEDEEILVYIDKIERLLHNVESFNVNCDGISAMAKELTERFDDVSRYADLAIKNMEVFLKYDNVISSYSKAVAEGMAAAVQSLAKYAVSINADLLLQSVNQEESIEDNCSHISFENAPNQSKLFSYSSADTELSYYHVDEYISIKVA